jgi:hypothetical protein
MALFGPNRPRRRCRYLGVKRTHSGHRGNDAIDPNRKSHCRTDAGQVLWGRLVFWKESFGAPVVNTNISPRLEARVRRDYPPQATEEVIAFLRTVSDIHAASLQDPERLQAAAFILLKGDVSRIPRVKMLVRDWRDSLVWAGLGQPDWPDRLNAMLGPLR